MKLVQVLKYQISHKASKAALRRKLREMILVLLEILCQSVDGRVLLLGHSA